MREGAREERTTGARELEEARGREIRNVFERVLGGKEVLEGKEGDMRS